jgi:hypothetical protein
LSESIVIPDETCLLRRFSRRQFKFFHDMAARFLFKMNLMDNNLRTASSMSKQRRHNVHSMRIVIQKWIRFGTGQPFKVSITDLIEALSDRMNELYLFVTDIMDSKDTNGLENF